MKYIVLLLLSLLLLSANGQSDDRVKLRDLQASPNPANTYIIRSLLDTAEWQLKSDFLFGIPFGSGTSGTLTKWTGTNTIGDAAITENATRLSASLPFRLANIPTVSLPGVPLAGDLVLNTTLGEPYFYNGSSWYATGYWQLSPTFGNDIFVDNTYRVAVGSTNPALMGAAKFAVFGASSSAANFSLVTLNSSNVRTFGVRNDGFMALGTGAAGFYPANAYVTYTPTLSGVGFVFNSTGQNVSANLAITSVESQFSNRASGTGYTATSGNIGALTSYLSFKPTSGTATWYGLQVDDYINQTGGSSGKTWGLRFQNDDTRLIAVSDYAAIESNNNKGLFIRQLGSAGGQMGNGKYAFGTTLSTGGSNFTIKINKSDATAALLIERTGSNNPPKLELKNLYTSAGLSAKMGAINFFGARPSGVEYLAGYIDLNKETADSISATSMQFYVDDATGAQVQAMRLFSDAVQLNNTIRGSSYGTGSRLLTQSQTAYLFGMKSDGEFGEVSLDSLPSGADGNGIYSGSDDLTDAVVTFARMPVIGDISFGVDFDGFTLGHFDPALESNLNFLNYDNTEYGLYILPTYQGVGLINGDGSTSLSELNLAEASAVLTANAPNAFGSAFLGSNRAEIYTDDETASSSGRRAGFYSSSANNSSQGEGSAIWYQYDQTGSANKYLVAGFEEGNNVTANPKLPTGVSSRGFYIQDYEQGTGTKNLFSVLEDGEAYVQDFVHVGGAFFTQTAIDTVNNTASETSLINTGVGTTTLPADYLEPGRTIICEGAGWWSNNSVTPSLQFRQKIGAVTVGATGAGSMPNLAGGQEFWEYKVIMTCQTDGASGTVMTQGAWTWQYSDFTDGRKLSFSNTTTATVNTTIANALDFTVQMGSADANAYVVMTNFVCEAKN